MRIEDESEDLQKRAGLQHADVVGRRGVHDRWWLGCFVLYRELTVVENIWIQTMVPVGAVFGGGADCCTG